MQPVQTNTQQSAQATPVHPSTPHHDPILVSAAVSMLFPFLIALIVFGYRKRRIARFKEQVARLERLWNLSPRR